MRARRLARIRPAALALIASVGLVLSAGCAGEVRSGAGGRWVTPVPSATPTPVPTTAPPSPSPPPPTATGPILRPGRVTINSPGFWSWALLDRGSGKITGSKNLDATSTTASMIKAWIAADFLRLNPNPSQARLDQLRIMIRDSDNEAAEEIFQLIGGGKSIARLISICKLTDSGAYRNWWSNTAVSARDTARMAACIGEGRAAGQRWTGWLLTEMRSVRGFGDFGIRKALPSDIAKRTAIKNGWILRDADSDWHIACLAIGDGWTLGVLARYPGSLGVGHGTNICKSVAAQLLTRTP